MRIALYVRTLKGDQQSLDTQFRDLREFAKARGWGIHHEYQDQGVEFRRPGLDRLMEDAKTHKFDLVLVWRLDRIARSSKHFALAVDALMTLGVQVQSLMDGFSTATAGPTVSALAQMERSIFRERVKAGIDAFRAAHGGFWGSPRKVDVAEVRRLHARGKKNVTIAKRLGISTKSVERALKSDKH